MYDFTLCNITCMCTTLRYVIIHVAIRECFVHVFRCLYILCCNSVSCVLHFCPLSNSAEVETRSAGQNIQAFQSMEDLRQHEKNTTNDEEQVTTPSRHPHRKQMFTPEETACVAEHFAYNITEKQTPSLNEC